MKNKCIELANRHKRDLYFVYKLITSNYEQIHNNHNLMLLSSSENYILTHILVYCWSVGEKIKFKHDLLKSQTESIKLTLKMNTVVDCLRFERV